MYIYISAARIFCFRVGVGGGGEKGSVYRGEGVVWGRGGDYLTEAFISDIFNKGERLTKGWLLLEEIWYLLEEITNNEPGIQKCKSTSIKFWTFLATKTVFGFSQTMLKILLIPSSLHVVISFSFLARK